MSPEQVEGQAPDHRSDIYGLGVVLYELLAGHRPHDATDLVDLRRQIVVGTLIPIPGVSKAGDAICRKCLSRNPADRYQDAAQLAHNLRRTTFTVRSASTRNRLLTLGAVVLFAMIGFLVVRGVLERDQSPVVEARATLPSERRAVQWVHSVGGFVNDTKRLDQLAEPWTVRSV